MAIGFFQTVRYFINYTMITREKTLKLEKSLVTRALNRIKKDPSFYSSNSANYCSLELIELEKEILAQVGEDGINSRVFQSNNTLTKELNWIETPLEIKYFTLKLKSLGYTVIKITNSSIAIGW